MEQFPLSDDTTAQVNVANGNLLITANDGTAASPGVGVRNDRFYNGLSTSLGALGGGWSSTMSYSDFGLGVNAAGTTATFYGPNGFRAIFVKSGTTWVTPAGFNATLTKTTDWYLKYNKTAETFRFNDTTQRLVSHYDRNGVGLTNNWAASATTFTVTDAAGRVTTVNHISGDSVINSVVDSAGRTTTYTRNSDGDLTQVDKPGGASTTMTYDSLHRLSTLTLPAAPGTTTVTFTYDASSRIKSLTRQSSSPTWGAAANVVTTFTYNAGSTVQKDPNGNSSTYAYDSSGRVTTATDALGRSKSQSWTTNSDVQTATDGFGANTALTYDSLNNATSATIPTGAGSAAVYALGASCPGGTTGDTYQVKCSRDPSGNTAGYTYDAAGNLTEKKDTSIGGTGASTQRYTYENSSRTVCGGFAGQVCSSKDGNNNVTTYQYTGAGNLRSVTPPAPIGATTYTYDGLGRVTSVIDGRGKVTGYGYDLRDRLVQTNFDGGSTLAVTFFPNGAPQYQSDSFTGTKQFEYDTLGHVTKQVGALTGLTEKYNYDPAGNLATYEDATGVVTYAYDVANQLRLQKEPGGTCPTFAGNNTGIPAANSGCTYFQYDNNGAETLRVFPAGARVITTNDASARVKQVQAKNAAGAVTADISYSYAAVSGDTTIIQKRTSTLEQGITVGAITSYTYDSLKRVTKAEEKAGSTVTASWAYGYDAAGNRTTQTRSGSTGAASGTTTYVYNAANEISNTSADTTAWVYDAAGNQTKNGSTGATAAFGDRGQVQTLGTTNFTQFGQGNTEQLTATGGRTFSASALGLSRQTSATTTQSYSRNAAGQATSFRITSSHYYVYDKLGSVIGMFGGTGIWEGGYSYSPYGEARFTGTDASVTTNQLRYIGSYQESTNLYKLGARYYEATTGRFTQYDPSGQESAPYQYASCNPVNAKDPTGLFCGATAAAGVGFGTLALASAASGIGAPLAVGFGVIALVEGIGSVFQEC